MLDIPASLPAVYAQDMTESEEKSRNWRKSSGKGRSRNPSG